ncbi:MAG: response regulator [Sphingobacteriales bacterium]|nr:MAG: response regulator [Sphingobacteriales bacterium]
MNNKILIIDDDLQILSLLEMNFIENGFTTMAISAAALVMPSILAFSPKVILMDIRLDDGDGRLICDELKADSRTQHIPIILLTGLSYTQISELECLADAIIGKPFDIQHLLQTVQQISNRADL